MAKAVRVGSCFLILFYHLLISDTDFIFRHPEQWPIDAVIVNFHRQFFRLKFRRGELAWYVFATFLYFVFLAPFLAPCGGNVRVDRNIGWLSQTFLAEIYRVRPKKADKSTALTKPKGRQSAFCRWTKTGTKTKVYGA